jgi:hypothetical protein
MAPLFYLIVVYFSRLESSQTNHNETAFMTTLLITGVTGFLGGAALEKILNQKSH